MKLISRLRDLVATVSRLERRLDMLQESVGRVEARQVAGIHGWHEHEFRVSSQWGEDGLIDHLVGLVGVERKVFVEFGVETYVEANTRFLLRHRGWSGLVMDGSAANVARIRSDPVYWQYNLKAQAAFITRENIDALLVGNGVQGKIGLLSIDIDGNDYWVWEAVSAVDPAIVVIEYNARFGAHRAVTVPYDPAFMRARAHYSMIYYGASLRALWLLGRRKGFDLVGCNAAGNNAFFVRSDLRPGNLPALEPESAWRAAVFREARKPDGSLAFLDAAGEAALLETLPLVEVESQGGRTG